MACSRGSSLAAMLKAVQVVSKRNLGLGGSWCEMNASSGASGSKPAATLTPTNPHPAFLLPSAFRWVSPGFPGAQRSPRILVAQCTASAAAMLVVMNLIRLD